VVVVSLVGVDSQTFDVTRYYVSSLLHLYYWSSDYLCVLIITLSVRIVHCVGGSTTVIFVRVSKNARQIEH